MPGSPGHLVRRFFDVAAAKPLTQSERDEVAAWVSDDLLRLFNEQVDADQRHGYHAALSVIDSGFDSAEVVTAALLHDVGKRHADLGLIGRSLASLLILARVPLTKRMTAYRDHGAVGGKELAAASAGSLAVDFATHHHGRRPTSIEPEVWSALVSADQPPKTRSEQRGRITSGP